MWFSLWQASSRFWRRKSVQLLVFNGAIPFRAPIPLNKREKKNSWKHALISHGRGTLVAFKLCGKHLQTFYPSNQTSNSNFLPLSWRYGHLWKYGLTEETRWVEKKTTAEICSERSLIGCDTFSGHDTSIKANLYFWPPKMMAKLLTQCWLCVFYDSVFFLV